MSIKKMWLFPPRAGAQTRDQAHPHPHFHFQPYFQDGVSSQLRNKAKLESSCVRGNSFWVSPQLRNKVKPQPRNAVKFRPQFRFQLGDRARTQPGPGSQNQYHDRLPLHPRPQPAAQTRALPLSLAALCLLLSASLLSGCGAAKQQAPPEATEAAVPVMVAEARHGDVAAAINFTGVLEPETVVNVVHKMGGKVAEVRVKDGARVQAGQLLIRLDAAELTAQAAQAEAACRMAQVQFEAAAKSFEDTSALYAAEIVSRQQFEQVETQYKIAEVQVAQAEAALQLVRTHLDDTQITAPIGGTVSGLAIKPGELVAPGIPVMAINQMDTMEINVQLTEKDVGRLTAGQKVEAVVSAVSPDTLEGEVVQISPVADPRTRTYALKVALANEAGRLKAGMTASVQAVIAVEKDAVIVPIEAILTQQGSPVVYIVEEGLARRRLVTLGLENGDSAGVREGISPGEQIVVRGQHYLKEGSRVTVVGGGAAQ